MVLVLVLLLMRMMVMMRLVSALSVFAAAVVVRYRRVHRPTSARQLVRASSVEFRTELIFDVNVLVIAVFDNEIYPLFVFFPIIVFFDVIVKGRPPPF